MNYFASRASAEKYIIGRPDFHDNTISRIQAFLNIHDKLPKALDVACGTGLSAKALLPIAQEVYATDLSSEMLNLALEKDKIHYEVAAAESQPFENEEFDLITVSSGIHWFNIDAFLIEANRLLKRKGWLVVYENFFAGEMDGDAGFKTWVNEVYIQRFPSPPRNKNYTWTADNLRSKNFTLQIPENFNNQVQFNKSQLISYFVSQSNIIAAVDSGAYTYAAIENWLNNELGLYFKDEAEIRIINYGNWIKYLQKI